MINFYPPYNALSSSDLSETLESNRNFYPFNAPDKNSSLILGTIDFEDTEFKGCLESVSAA